MTGFTQTLRNSCKLLNFVSTIKGYWKLLKNVSFVSLLSKTLENVKLLYSAVNQFHCITDLMHTLSNCVCSVDIWPIKLSYMHDVESLFSSVITIYHLHIHLYMYTTLELVEFVLLKILPFCGKSALENSWIPMFVVCIHVIIVTTAIHVS